MTRIGPNCGRPFRATLNRRSGVASFIHVLFEQPASHRRRERRGCGSAHYQYVRNNGQVHCLRYIGIPPDASSPLFSSLPVEFRARARDANGVPMLGRLRRVHELLAEDEATDLSTLHERDRAIGVKLSHLDGRSDAQILAWAAARDSNFKDIPSDDSAGPGFILSLLGFVIGLFVCAGALYFEGGGRVNVVSLLGMLVGLQILSLLFTALGMLPGVLRGVRGLRGLSDALSMLSPARAGLAALRRWFPGTRESLDVFWSDSRRGMRLFARVRRWAAWRLSQNFAVAFNVGLVLCFALMVVFTDLAFGWSTTLQVDAATIHSLVSAMATPWAEFFPQALPSLQLVESSRYFRAQPLQVVDAELLGQWWRFVLASLLVYGLAPRVILALFARWRFGRAVRWTLLHLPGANELVYRLNKELVTTHASAAVTDDAPPTDTVRQVTVAPASGSCSLVVWGDFDCASEDLVNEVRAASTLDAVEVHAAGGRQPPEEDRKLIDRLSQSQRPVALAVKAWEPPLAEFADFLSELRRVSQESRPLVVVPVPESERAAPRREDVAIWRARLSKLADPWLSVRATSAEHAS